MDGHTLVFPAALPAQVLGDARLSASPGIVSPLPHWAQACFLLALLDDLVTSPTPPPHALQDLDSWIAGQGILSTSPVTAWPVF